MVKNTDVYIYIPNLIGTSSNNSTEFENNTVDSFWIFT